jgi:hypothetical protein
VEQRRSDDEQRRADERALSAAATDEERGRARVRVAAGERRRGELDLAALALEQALREGAEPELVAPELAAVLALDAGEPGARRAVACFEAVRPPEPVLGPFPLVRGHGAVRLAAKRAELFTGVARALPRETTLELARSVAAILPGDPATGELAPLTQRTNAADWPRALGRDVDASLARALDDLYGRLQGIRRHRVCARLDTPGPLRETGSNRFHVAGDACVLALADSHLALVYRSESDPERLTLYDERPLAGEPVFRQTTVLAGAPADLEPRVVASTGGTYVLGVDARAGEVLVSFSAFGRPDVMRARKRAGKTARIAAASPCARGVAVFLARAGRAFTVSPAGEVSRERRLGTGLEVTDAASLGQDVYVLARRGAEALLQRLDADLEPVGEPVKVPRLRSPGAARLAWPVPEIVLVIEPPDVAHAFGADERGFAWTARIREPLEGLAPVSGEALELLAYGAIESEWGLRGADAGLARWTRDGLGRHGPTVRVESPDPSRALDSVEVATNGGRAAVVTRAGRDLSLRTVELLATPARIPGASEWTYALGELPGDA